MTDDYPTEYDIKGLDAWPQKLLNRLRGIRSRFTAVAARMGGDGVLYPGVDRTLWRTYSAYLTTTTGADIGIIPNLAAWLGVPESELGDFVIRMSSRFDVRTDAVSGDTVVWRFKTAAGITQFVITVTAADSTQVAQPVSPKYTEEPLGEGMTSLQYDFGSWAAAETHSGWVHVWAYRLIPARR